MKFSQDSIILILSVLGLGMLLIWKTRGVAAVTVTPEAPIDAAASSPLAANYYTSFNNANEAVGYNFGPPVNMTIPPQTMGIAGAASSVARALGCKSCG